MTLDPSKDYRRSIIELVPWIDRELMFRVLQTETVIRGVVPPAFGDGTLPIPPSFFPLIHPDPNDTYLQPVGIWIRDPRTLDGVLATYIIEDGMLWPHGRTGIRVALDMLENHWDSEDQRPAFELASLLFPEASATDRNALVARIGAGDYNYPSKLMHRDLMTWPVVARYVRPGDDGEPPVEKNGPTNASGYSLIKPQKRFAEALASGDVLAAWAAMESSSWAQDEAVDAWMSLAPNVDSRLRVLVDQKLVLFPLEDGL